MPQDYCVGVELGATINRASRKGSLPQDSVLLRTIVRFPRYSSICPVLDGWSRATLVQIR
jgi:hypothetical protein